MNAQVGFELSAPPVGEVQWVGWSRDNPNRVGRATARLWFDARESIRRELGLTDVTSVEVVKVES